MTATLLCSPEKKYTSQTPPNPESSGASSLLISNISHSQESGCSRPLIPNLSFQGENKENEIQWPLGQRMATAFISNYLRENIIQSPSSRCGQHWDPILTHPTGLLALGNLLRGLDSQFSQLQNGNRSIPIAGCPHALNETIYEKSLVIVSLCLNTGKQTTKHKINFQGSIKGALNVT